VWRADIAKFFDSVDHAVLKRLIRRHVADLNALNLLDLVIDSYQHNNHGGGGKHGIPIGNLTSQIFANLYLNEFDRYIRHNIKPLGYMRYGDDFVLFMPTYKDVISAKVKATQWLSNTLCLRVHAKNNNIQKAWKGLYFLGHKIYPYAPMSIDSDMQAKVYQKVTPSNVGSYSAMRLSAKRAKQLPWLLIS
jgi:retron-type reverse transcriptase